MIGRLSGPLLLMLSVGAPMLRAQEADPVDRGTQIAVEADRRVRGFGDYRVSVDMVLRDARGGETLRELDFAALEVSDSEERMLVIFLNPPDVRGTALLTHSLVGRDDDQWLYLPALRRTKRITASGRSSPFMGSEFAYEDLVPTRVTQYAYRFLREDTLDGRRSFVVERTPGYEGTGYSRQELWIDTDQYRLLRVDSWDLRGRPLKMLALRDYERHADAIWRPAAAEMVNLRTEESTLLRWRDYRLRTGLRESDFNPATLGRVRAP